jgi:hypothetical protein
MDNLIANIAASHKRLTGRNGWGAEQFAVRAAAAEAFADLNGWLPTDDPGRRFDVFSKPDGRYDPRRGATERLDWRVFDHTQFFVWADRPRRAAAIVTQPYNENPNQLPQVFGKLGGKDVVELVWHVPPIITASFHMPGSARFYVLTRPETPAVKWLPEQLVRQTTSYEQCSREGGAL